MTPWPKPWRHFVNRGGFGTSGYPPGIGRVTLLQWFTETATKLCMSIWFRKTIQTLSIINSTPYQHIKISTILTPGRGARVPIRLPVRCRFHPFADPISRLGGRVAPAWARNNAHTDSASKTGKTKIQMKAALYCYLHDWVFVRKPMSSSAPIHSFCTQNCERWQCDVCYFCQSCLGGGIRQTVNK